MSKPILVEGVPHRRRRGRLVPIPAEWLGRTTSRQTLAKRASDRAARRANTRHESRSSDATIDKRKVRAEEDA